MADEKPALGLGLAGAVGFEGLGPGHEVDLVLVEVDPGEVEGRAPLEHGRPEAVEVEAGLLGELSARRLCGGLAGLGSAAGGEPPRGAAGLLGPAPREQEQAVLAVEEQDAPDLAGRRVPTALRVARCRPSGP